MGPLDCCRFISLGFGKLGVFRGQSRALGQRPLAVQWVVISCSVDFHMLGAPISKPLWRLRQVFDVVTAMRQTVGIAVKGNLVASIVYVGAGGMAKQSRCKLLCLRNLRCQ